MKGFRLYEGSQLTITTLDFLAVLTKDPPAVLFSTCISSLSSAVEAGVVTYDRALGQVWKCLLWPSSLLSLINQMTVNALSLSASFYH